MLRSGVVKIIDFTTALKGAGKQACWVLYLKSHRPLVARARTQPVWPFKVALLSNSAAGSCQVETDLAALPQNICRRVDSRPGTSAAREKIGPSFGCRRTFSTALECFMHSPSSAICKAYEALRRQSLQALSICCAG